MKADRINQDPVHRQRLSLLHPGHGSFGCSAGTLDQMMMLYLPASKEEMEAKLVEMRSTLRNVCPGVNWDDVSEVSTALMILGDLSKHQTGDQ